MTLAWTDDEVHSRMRRGWGGGCSEGTPCGKGSTLAHTKEIRERLPQLVRDYHIVSIFDAGAGDMHWIKRVEWDVTYRAFDLVPRDPSVTALDITKEALPPCDLILCRIVLNHLDPKRVQSALELFRQSGKYLLATQHDGTNSLKGATEHNKWNLSVAPFGLGAPLESIADARPEYPFWLSLWKL